MQELYIVWLSAIDVWHTSHRLGGALDSFPMCRLVLYISVDNRFNATNQVSAFIVLQTACMSSFESFILPEYMTKIDHYLGSQ